MRDTDTGESVQRERLRVVLVSLCGSPSTGRVDRDEVRKVYTGHDTFELPSVNSYCEIQKYILLSSV